jgi:hypothetical protein
MGIVFVLIFYAIALTIGASIASNVLGSVAYGLTKHSGAGRRRAVLASKAFPFLCVAFAGGWFVVYAITNYTVFHRDPGLGDGWETPLPNGYALMMIDTTDQGTVVVNGENVVDGARQLQVSKSLIFGARDTGYLGRLGQESKFVDSYFELNATNGAYKEFKTIDELRKQAASEGVLLQLRPFESVFGDYRTTWFDYVAGVILLLVPSAGFIALVRWVWRTRRNTTPDLSPTVSVMRN